MGHLFNAMPESRAHQLEANFANTLADLALKSSTLDLDGAEDLVVRDILPGLDLESGDENGWGTGDEEWRQDYSGQGGSADAYNESYKVDSSSQADDKIVGFNSVTQLSPDPITRTIRFGSGTSGAQGVRAWFSVERLESDDEGTGYFANPIIYGASADGNIEHWVEDLLDNKRVVFGGLVAEGVGTTISEPQNPRIEQPRTGGGARSQRATADGGLPQPDHGRRSQVSPAWMSDEYREEVVPRLPKATDVARTVA